MREVILDAEAFEFVKACVQQGRRDAVTSAAGTRPHLRATRAGAEADRDCASRVLSLFERAAHVVVRVEEDRPNVHAEGSAT